MAWGWEMILVADQIAAFYSNRSTVIARSEATTQKVGLLRFARNAGDIWTSHIATKKERPKRPLLLIIRNSNLAGKSYSQG